MGYHRSRNCKHQPFLLFDSHFSLESAIPNHFLPTYMVNFSVSRVFHSKLLEIPSKLFPRLINKCKRWKPVLPSTAPAKNNKHIRSFHLLLVCTNVPQLSFWLHSSAASFSGPSGPRGLLSPSSDAISWALDLPLDLSTSSQGSIFRPAALSQSPALCYFVIGIELYFSLWSMPTPLHMSVIIKDNY